MKGQIADAVGLLFFGFVVVVLVRPSSVGPAAITQIGTAVSSLVSAATAP